ncbi:MAG: DNA repair protein RadA [bacterium]|nr:DNA repair protein RadA [bacterium]
MAREKNSFTCQSCGASTGQWAGRCNACGEWNTIVEELSKNSGIAGGPSKKQAKGLTLELEALDTEVADVPRLMTDIAEFDRVTGGGLVAGSAILVGGEPGIGKSTLLLQVAAVLAKKGHRALYFSGEEATAQVRLRARRLKVTDAPVDLAAETNVANILATLEAGAPPAIVIIDSIQTVWSDNLDAAPGTVSQVRACSQHLVRYAKRSGAALLIVGHVTKDGQIAGPKVVEHMVDTVLYFEGDSGHQFRILRAVKNRFGATDEIGVFEMKNEGLAEVANPSEMFLGDRNDDSPGSAVFAGIEGSRPVLVEIQALVAASSLATPRRAVVGCDSNRLAMIIAVLSARCGLRFGAHDVYLNVAGGLRITEPAADVAIAAALISALSGIALPIDRVFFGEISLSGAVRNVGHMGARLKEARKLGFKTATMPMPVDGETPDKKMLVENLPHLSALTANILGSEGEKSLNSDGKETKNS